jgi:hypothetical protein
MARGGLGLLLGAGFGLGLVVALRALVRVVPQSEFDRWLGRQQLVEPQPGTPSGAATGAPSEGASSSASGT